MPGAADILGADGPFAARLTDFVPRACQQEMALAIADALADRATLVVESGTGTGKTFAYLVPALLSGKKVLISTGTRNLQDQVFHRDLPLVRDALGIAVTAALLKGRANYLCLYRLDLAELEGRFAQREQVAELERIRDWAGRTRRGDIAEMSAVPENSPLWPLVTSTPDNCLGGRCPRFDDCYVNRARREAVGAEVLVVNHHLFFADLVLREDGFGQLLPGVDAVIFDEAHQLPEVASNFFGVVLSSHQLHELARDSVQAELKEKSAVAGLADRAHALEKAAADFRLALGMDVRRAPWAQLDGNRDFPEALADLKRTLSALADALEPAAAKGEGLANCWQRATTLLDRLLVITENPPADYVAWFETSARAFRLNLTPLEVGVPFRQQMDGTDKAWIFTSATLTIDGRFDFFLAQLGLEQAQTARWDSPFDYTRQALLYLPADLPDPASPDYTRTVVEHALPVLAASRGRAFLLFTSHRALTQAAALLADRLPYPLFVQGSAPRNELLERFRAAGDGVLLGTASFWEGVDVRGEALSCVIIDKLPFAAPDDPVLRARGAAMEQAGRKPFMEYQLPNAVIALKQGVGRLIRDAHDRGVLMLCDPRLLSKGYGRIFLSSLPPMSRTRELADVEAFFTGV